MTLQQGNKIDIYVDMKCFKELTDKIKEIKVIPPREPSNLPLKVTCLVAAATLFD